MEWNSGNWGTRRILGNFRVSPVEIPQKFKILVPSGGSSLCSRQECLEFLLLLNGSPPKFPQNDSYGISVFLSSDFLCNATQVLKVLPCVELQDVRAHSALTDEQKINIKSTAAHFNTMTLQAVNYLLSVSSQASLQQHSCPVLEWSTIFQVKWRKFHAKWFSARKFV